MDTPLVSVIVVAYNSSKYILETLQSIYNQTYQNIELIVTDDHSTDDTVNVCKNYLKQFEDRFVRTIIVESPVNTGVSANDNRGLMASSGEWIKYIAGDDLLEPDCIEKFVKYISKYDAGFVFSNINQLINGVISKQPVPNQAIAFFKLNAEEQYERLIEDGMAINLSPSAFIKASILKQNPFDERFKFQDDYPKFVDLAKKGVKLHFMDEYTTTYRMTDSLSNSYSRFYSPKFMDSEYLFYLIVRKPELERFHFNNAISKAEKKYLIYLFSLYRLNNKRTFLNRVRKKFFDLFLR